MVELNEDSYKLKEPQPQVLRSLPEQKTVALAVDSVAAWPLLIHRESYQVRSVRLATRLPFGPTHPAFVSGDSSGDLALESVLAVSKSHGANATCRQRK